MDAGKTSSSSPVPRPTLRNGRLDRATETIHGEFFHTTPPDEAATSLHTAVKLDRSHGCIHLKPLELDEMVRRKFMRKGARVVVHRYDELLVRYPKGTGAAPYELHFYPALHKLLIVGARR